MPWLKNGRIKTTSKLQLQVKGNPIHITEWLIHLSNLIILGTHTRNSNIDLGIQIQRLSSATLGNWSAGMKFGNHNNKRQVAKIHGTTTKRSKDEQSRYSYHMNCIRDNYLRSRLSRYTTTDLQGIQSKHTINPHLLQLLMKIIKLT